MKITRKQKKWIIIAAGALLLVLGAGLGFGFSKREAYLQRAVSRVQQKLKTDYDVDFAVNEYQFRGLTTVQFDDVTVVPQDRDTLAAMQSLAVSIKIWPLLFGDVRIADLHVSNGKVTLVKKDTLSNYDFLFRRKAKDSTSTEEPNEKNFALWVEKLTDKAFALIPEDLNMQDFEISYRDSSTFQKIRVPEAIVNGGDFETSLFLNENDAEWILKGEIDDSEKRIKVEISSREKDTEIPFLRRKLGLKVSFDKMIFDLESIKRKGDGLLHVFGAFSYENLVVNHRRLSDKDILLPHAQVTGGLDISTDFIQLSPGTTVEVEKFAVQPQLKYTAKPERKIELAVHTGQFPAQDFFDALPDGLFESLDGVKVQGDVAYDLDFSVNIDNPDQIVFASSIDDDALKVLEWGTANIDSLNYPFEYDAYDDTTLVKRITVGPSNPHFTPLASIPYILKTTVRNTEDPFFYKHNGFEEEAFQLSIVTNIKEKKFKRGASTLSMQLIKNLYLNRKKTMSRKFEEILLVWLMEASGKVSKDRLFEIYLNVIEWGKGVYGISEAAQYYFTKKPQDLNMGESLFLSSIIPRPKTGLSSFEYTGYLKPWVQRHFNTYGYIMNKVGDLKDVEVPAGYGFYEVVLQPGLRPAAPAVRDTSAYDLDFVAEHEEIMREIEQEEKTKRSVLDKLFGKEQK